MDEIRRNTYVACQELNFIWDLVDVIRFDQMWKDGLSIIEIAEKFDRDPDEIVILIIDRAQQFKIKSRENSVTQKKKKSENKRKMMVKKINVPKLRELYMKPELTIYDIADHFKAGISRCFQIIRRERIKNPDLWPQRRKVV